MKILTIYIILIFSTVNTYGQFGFGRLFCGGIGEVDSISYFYTTKTDTIIGKIPDNNKFNGELKQYKKYYHKIKNLLEEGQEYKEENLQYQYGIFSKLLLKANFKNGVKSGTWIYYTASNIYMGGHTIDYRLDTIIVRPIDNFDKEIIYISDSSQVFGMTKTPSEITISFECKKKSSCNYVIKGTDNIIADSDISDLELILFKFETGVFDREIKMKMNNKILSPTKAHTP